MFCGSLPRVQRPRVLGSLIIVQLGRQLSVSSQSSGVWSFAPERDLGDKEGNLHMLCGAPEETVYVCCVKTPVQMELWLRNTSRENTGRILTTDQEPLILGHNDAVKQESLRWKHQLLRHGTRCGKVFQGLRPNSRHHSEERIWLRGEFVASKCPWPYVCILASLFFVCMNVSSAFSTWSGKDMCIFMWRNWMREPMCE